MRDSTGSTPAQLSAVLVRAYPHAGLLQRFMIRWRTFICPFHEILRRVPRGWSFVDVGCGLGLMSVLLVEEAKARRVLGFDTSIKAVSTALRADLPAEASSTFVVLDAAAAWPTETVDGAVCIDVLHHVPRDEQRAFVGKLARLGWTGKLFFKDVAPRPGWMALASRLHDLLLARQWISIRDEHEVRRWFEEEGLVVSAPERMHMLWYSHYALTVERRAATA